MEALRQLGELIQLADGVFLSEPDACWEFIDRLLVPFSCHLLRRSDLVAQSGRICQMVFASLAAFGIRQLREQTDRSLLPSLWLCIHDVLDPEQPFYVAQRMNQDEIVPHQLSLLMNYFFIELQALDVVRERLQEPSDHASDTKEFRYILSTEDFRFMVDPLISVCRAMPAQHGAHSAPEILHFVRTFFRNMVSDDTLMQTPPDCLMMLLSKCESLMYALPHMFSAVDRVRLNLELAGRLLRCQFAGNQMTALQIVEVRRHCRCCL